MRNSPAITPGPSKLWPQGTSGSPDACSGRISRRNFSEAEVEPFTEPDSAR